MADSINVRVLKYGLDGRRLAVLTPTTFPGRRAYSIIPDVAVGRGGIFAIAIGGFHNDIQDPDEIIKFDPTTNRQIIGWRISGATLSGPKGLAFDDSTAKIHVADTGNNRIVVFNADGTHFRSFDDGGELNAPKGIEIDRFGNIYVADGNHRIVKYASNYSRKLAEIGSQGSGRGQFNQPSDVTVDGSGHIYVADPLNNRVVMMRRTLEEGGGGGFPATTTTTIPLLLERDTTTPINPIPFKQP